MQPDQLIWNQIEQIHEYLRLIGTQGVTWFVFGLGADAAALWAILANNISLKTKNVPYALAFFNLVGAIFCFLMPFYYYHAAMNINSLTRHLSTEIASTNSTSLTSNSTVPATEHTQGICTDYSSGTQRFHGLSDQSLACAYQ